MEAQDERINDVLRYLGIDILPEFVVALRSMEIESLFLLDSIRVFAFNSAKKFALSQRNQTHLKITDCSDCTEFKSQRNA